MSENQPTGSQPSPEDPLATLHRMSTTAGLGSQDYVAINLWAVVTLVLGIACSLVLLSNMLLVIPLAAIVFGIASLRQISGSNGTQTGRGIAWLGMLLGVGMCAFVGVRQYQDWSAARAEQAAIEQTVAALDKLVLSGKYAETWDLFSNRFKQAKGLTQEQFAARWKQLDSNETYGKITGIHTNNRIAMEVMGDGTKAAATMIVITFSKTDQAIRREMYFRKEPTGWIIEDIPVLFPTPEVQPSAPPGPG